MRKSLSKIQNLDFFPKPLEDIREKANSGAIITIIATIIMCFLFYSEFMEYISPDTQDTIFVDFSRDERMNFNLDFTLHKVACEALEIDIVDSTGEQQLNVTRNIEKQPFSGDMSSGMIPRIRSFGRKSSGCRVFGSVDVAKVQGNLHIAAGHSTVQSHDSHKHHLHHLRPEDLNFEVTHRINHFSIGPNWPKRVNPLDGVLVEKEKMTQVNYMLQIVPTVYEKANGESIHTYQFSVTENIRTKEPGSSSFPLPGLFIKWDISPYMIKYVEPQTSFSHFLTRACAIAGGSWVVLGLIYGATQTAVTKLKKKDM